MMEANDTDEIRKHLMQTSEEYREMARQRQEYKTQVLALENNPHATEQDEIEEHRLKKLKLHLKDQMEEMVSRYKAQHV